MPQPTSKTYGKHRLPVRPRGGAGCVIPCHATTYHAMACHFVSSHVTACHVRPRGEEVRRRGDGRTEIPRERIDERCTHNPRAAAHTRTPRCSALCLRELEAPEKRPTPLVLWPRLRSRARACAPGARRSSAAKTRPTACRSVTSAASSAIRRRAKPPCAAPRRRLRRTRRVRRRDCRPPAAAARRAPRSVVAAARKARCPRSEEVALLMAGSLHLLQVALGTSGGWYPTPPVTQAHPIEVQAENF